MRLFKIWPCNKKCWQCIPSLGLQYVFLRLTICFLRISFDLVFFPASVFGVGICFWMCHFPDHCILLLEVNMYEYCSICIDEHGQAVMSLAQHKYLWYWNFKFHWFQNKNLFNIIMNTVRSIPIYVNIKSLMRKTLKTQRKCTHGTVNFNIVMRFRIALIGKHQAYPSASFWPFKTHFRIILDILLLSLHESWENFPF